MGPHRPTRRAVSKGGCNRSGKGAPLRAQCGDLIPLGAFRGGFWPRRAGCRDLWIPGALAHQAGENSSVDPSPAVRFIRQFSCEDGALQARAAMPTDSLRHLFSRRDRKRKNLRHQNSLKNNRKIVARRCSRTNLCNKATLHQEYTRLVKYLVFEPRTQIFNSMPRLPQIRGPNPSPPQPEYAIGCVERQRQQEQARADR